MTPQEQNDLIEYGKLINLKVTPVEIEGEPGVHYMGYESVNFKTVLRDLEYQKSQIPEKR